MNSRSLAKILALSAFIILAVLPVVYMYAVHFSIDRYLWIYKDVRQQGIFERTIYLGIGAALLSVIFGVSASVLIEYTNLPYKSVLRVLLIISLLLPPYITSMSYLVFLGKAGLGADSREPIPETASIVRKDILTSSNNNSGIQIRSALPVSQSRSTYLPFDIDPYKIEFAAIMLSFSFFPLVFLMITSALRSVDSKLEDAAKLLYSPVKVLTKITFPLVLPHVLASGLIVFIFSISEMGVPSLFRINTLALEVLNHFTAFFDAGQALGLSFPLVASLALLILAVQLLMGKKSYITVCSSPKKDLIKLGPVQRLISLFYILLLVSLSSIIPLAMLLIESKFMFMEALREASDSILNSVLLGILCASIMIVISFFVAYAACRNRKMDYLILFPLIVPSAALGIGMIGIWNNESTAIVYGSFLILAFGCLARLLPYTVKALMPFMEQLPASLEESGRLAGASFAAIVQEILLPLMKPGVITAWLVGFILCMRELDVSVTLTPPGFQTLPNRIFTLYHYGNTEMAVSLSLFLVAIVLVPFIVLIMISRASKWRTYNSRE
jgi:iron(III) transport system permease protein